MQPEVMTVSQFSRYINELVSVIPVLVEGEVSNYRDIPGRNFCYFDIKDKDAVCKCFQGFWSCPKIQLENGSLIRVYGVPSFQRNGSLVIDVRDIQLIGEGALMKAYLELKENLAKEGVFDEMHKKKLPKFPRKIGLIAGKNSSAYHDVAAEVMERWGGADLFFHPSKVQGIYAKKEVIGAIQYFNKKNPVDILIVARGGGSLEELQAFDSEEVVREIFASNIPIISAIGHEDHWTLSDFVSDMRAKTPTKAAQLAVPDRNDIQERLGYYEDRLSFVLNQKLKGSHSLLEGISQKAQSIQLANIDQARRNCHQMLGDCGDIMRSRIERLLNDLDNFQKSLDLMNPQRILMRGFAVIEKGGKRIESLKDVSVGDEIVTTLQDGYFEGTINRKFGKNNNNSNE